MDTKKLFGRTYLMDGMSGFMFDGEIALLTDFRRRSEIQVRDGESGEEERLVFSTGQLYVPVMQMIQVITELHTSTQVRFVTTPDSAVLIPAEPERCPKCGGYGFVVDEWGYEDVCECRA